MSLYKDGFYKKLEDFLKSNKKILKEKKIPDYKKKTKKIKLSILAIKTCNKMSSKFIIELFYEKITEEHNKTTFKKEILNNNVDFFLSDNFKKIMEKNLEGIAKQIINVNDLLDINDTWEYYDEKQKKDFLNNMKMLVILSERYIKSKI